MRWMPRGCDHLPAAALRRSESLHLSVFIYARTDSRRLPGKVLRPFGDTTLLQQVIDRARQVDANSWSLLTSDRRVDDRLATAARRAGLEVVRGSATDLVARTVTAIKTLHVDRFVRINGDSPLFEPRLVNAALQRGSREGLISNVIERRFPYGVATEIVDATLFRRLAGTARPEESEHVTKHLYRQPLTATILSLTQQVDHSHIRLAVDTIEDYGRVLALFDTPSSRLAPYWELLSLPEPVLNWHSVGAPLEGLDS